MNVAYFTPTADGQLGADNRSASWDDAIFLHETGARLVDLTASIGPRSSIEEGRNLAVSRAISSGCEWLYMVDSDVAAPGALRALMASARQLGATVAGAAVMCRGGRKLNVAPVNVGAIYECDWVSAACVLLDLRRACDLDLPVPWFRRVHNDAMTATLLDEGAWFSGLVKRAGGRVICDYRITTKHRGYGNALTTSAPKVGTGDGPKTATDDGP